MHLFNPPASTDFHQQMKNTVFHSWFPESVNTKPEDREGPLYIYEKHTHINEPMQIKPVLFKGQPYFQVPRLS